LAIAPAPVQLAARRSGVHFHGIVRNKDGVCRVRAVERVNGTGKILLISELLQSLSTSVTNLVENLAPETIRTPVR
jgi:hypothetical protein